ncbi:39S ribosomal protein L42, mitochondrial [Venturia canescens]|uniref:39S ribosomal protein L42, mitochondrial n=1 Tax=Venturia canescens TaxID=32260 RepID=UPI001C9D23A2|nr:39S ribosomal protein L42, mitochondrial [Venturia canescens]
MKYMRRRQFIQTRMALFPCTHWMVKLRNIQAKHLSSLTKIGEAVIFPNEETIVCWHPDKNFPYKYSQPLPREEHTAFSTLKISAPKARATFARKKDNKTIAEECAKLTHTTMHPWFPRSRDKKAKKSQADRPFL